MIHIVGRITDRILSGAIPREYVMNKTPRGEWPPSAAAIRYGKGCGLGSSLLKRNGETEEANANG